MLPTSTPEPICSHVAISTTCLKLTNHSHQDCSPLEPVISRCSTCAQLDLIASDCCSWWRESEHCRKFPCSVHCAKHSQCSKHSLPEHRSSRCCSVNKVAWLRRCVRHRAPIARTCEAQLATQICWELTVNNFSSQLLVGEKFFFVHGSHAQCLELSRPHPILSQQALNFIVLKAEQWLS